MKLTTAEAIAELQKVDTLDMPARLCEAHYMAIKALEQEPKTGHWIGEKKVGFGEWKDVTVLVNKKGCVTDSCECSECGDWLTGSDEYECAARYCPNCGARMESEG